MGKRKQDIISLKVDDSLLEALTGIPNRSEFIRSAILSALAGVCPLCRGSGVLSPNQQEHWRAFAGEHSIAECEQCQEVHLVCAQGRGQEPHPA